MFDGIPGLMPLVMCILMILYIGCGPAPTGKAREVENAAKYVEEEKPPGGIPLERYETTEETIREVQELALDIAAEFGFERDKLYVMGHMELVNFPDFWLWSVDIDSENEPAARVLLRKDVNRVEDFDAFPSHAPRAADPGRKVPDITASRLQLQERGFRLEEWLSTPGSTVYRGYVPISGFDVVVANVTIRFDTGSGLLIGANWRELPPITGFTMTFDKEEAIEAAGSHLGRQGLTPLHVTLVQIQDGITAEERNVYWEVHSDEGLVYVRCDDGKIAVNNAGLALPIGF